MQNLRNALLYAEQHSNPGLLQFIGCKNLDSLTDEWKYLSRFMLKKIVIAYASFLFHCSHCYLKDVLGGNFGIFEELLEMKQWIN